MKLKNQLKILIGIIFICVHIKLLPIMMWSSLPIRETQLYNLFIIITTFYLIVLFGMKIDIFKKSSEEKQIKEESINYEIVVFNTFLYLLIIPISIFFGTLIVTSSNSGSGTIIEYYYLLVTFIALLYFVKYTKVFIRRFVATITNILQIICITIMAILLLIGLYQLIISVIENYNSNIDFYNIYIVVLLAPGIFLISQKTKKYFIFVYIIAIASSYYFHIYKYSHDYEVIFEKQGISCWRSDDPINGCLFESISVHKGDEIETLDGKKEVSTQNINTFCVNGDNGRPFTYYFLSNNTIYKYIHKVDTHQSK